MPLRDTDLNVVLGQLSPQAHAFLDRPAFILLEFPRRTLQEQNVAGRIELRARARHKVAVARVATERVHVLDTPLIASFVGLSAEPYLRQAQAVRPEGRTANEVSPEERNALFRHFARFVLESLSSDNAPQVEDFDDHRSSKSQEGRRQHLDAISLGVLHKDIASSPHPQSRQVALMNWLARELIQRDLGYRQHGVVQYADISTCSFGNTHLFEMMTFVRQG